MPPRSNVPIRICGSKTRTGCKTCKQRHLKCDERRPICLRCQKSNRHCVYERPQSEAPRSRKPQQSSYHDQSAGYEIAVATRHHSYPGSLSPGSDISPFGSYEVAEICAVKNFVAHLGKELAGSFADDVWCHICPQVAQHEPLIWSAMAAVSMLDASIRSGHDRSTGNPDLSIAIKQYSKALQELNTQLGKTKDQYNRDVVLLSCLLFAVFECLQSHVASALRHISGGMNLLIEWGNEARSNNTGNTFGYLNRTQLLPVFFALDSQAIQMGAVSFRNDFAIPAIDDQLQIPETFASIQDAHLSLNHIFNRLSHWEQWKEPSVGCGNIPDDDWLTVEENTLRSQLAAWDTAFEVPLKLCFYQPATVLLLVQRKVIEVVFEKRADGPSEMEWDNYMPLFEEAVKYAEAYMKLSASGLQSCVPTIEARSSQTYKSRPVFTVAMDVVMSLFLISTRCRDPNIRRRALTMLKACGRKEGIWDSGRCALLVERWIALEESAAQSNGYIPECARIYEFDMRLQEETGAEIVYRKFVQDGRGRHRIETVQETIIW